MKTCGILRTSILSLLSASCSLSFPYEYDHRLRNVRNHQSSSTEPWYHVARRNTPQYVTGASSGRVQYTVPMQDVPYACRRPANATTTYAERQVLLVGPLVFEMLPVQQSRIAPVLRTFVFQKYVAELWHAADAAQRRELATLEETLASWRITFTRRPGKVIMYRDGFLFLEHGEFTFKAPYANGIFDREEARLADVNTGAAALPLDLGVSTQYGVLPLMFSAVFQPCPAGAKFVMLRLPTYDENTAFVDRVITVLSYSLGTDGFPGSIRTRIRTHSISNTKRTDLGLQTPTQWTWR